MDSRFGFGFLRRSTAYIPVGVRGNDVKIINQIFYSLVTGCLISLFITVNAMAAPVSTWNFSEGTGPRAADSSGSNTAILGHEDFNNGFTGSLWVPKAYLVTTPLTDTTQPIDITDAGGVAKVIPSGGVIELYASSIGTAGSDVYNYSWIEQTGSPAFLAGDFDVSIGYNRVDGAIATTNYAVPFRFLVNFSNGGYIYAEYYTQSNVRYVRGVSQLNSSAGATTGALFAAPASGALRLKRVGTTWTMYYLNGGSWTTLHTVTSAPITTGTSILAVTYNNRRNGALTFRTQLDNFWVYTSPSWTSGHVDLGNAVSFDGADDYLSLGDIGTMENIGTFSAEFWMKGPSTQKDWAVLIAKGSDQDLSSSWRIQRAGATDVLRWSVTNTSGTSASTLTTSTIFDNQWHHIAATYDGTDIKVYRDGVLEGTPGTLTGNILNSTNVVSMGNYNATSYAGTLNWTARAYSGLLDNVVVYNSVLDATTIAQHADVINIPKAVTDLNASYSGGNFSLNWTAPASGSKPITSYEIYYSSDAFATSGISVADSDGNAANATATVTVPLFPQLSFKIKAVNSAGTGPDSNIVTLSLIPDAVTTLTAAYNGSNFQLDWTAPNSNGPAITSYQIYYSSDGFATAGSLISDTDGNAADATATVAGITLTPQLSFRIKAVNGAGTGPDSNIATVILIPSAITDLTASYNGGSNSFQLNWTAPNNNGSSITGYEIYYSSDGFSTAGTLVSDTDGNATNAAATITGLTLVPSMSFRIRAVNIAGTGPDSNTALVTFAQPNAITTLNVVPGVADGQATLTWTAPADNGEPITDYIVEYDAGSGWQIFNDGVSTTTGAIVTGLNNASPGLAVDFRVTTTNQYLSSLSNVAYGFPFPAESVVWVYADETYTTGDLSGNAEAESSKTISQDGGVEATITSNAVTTCWYGGCTTYYPSYVGLSPPDYDQQMPKYAMVSKWGSTSETYIFIKGALVTTIAGSGVVRVERVGTEIKFVMSNIVRYTADISAETFTDLVADAYAPGSVSTAKIYGAGLQGPTTTTNLKASPGYGDGQVSLIWTAAYDNNDPITDYLVEYDTGSGWQTFVHSAITTPGITVTGLDNTVPGSAVQFRVAAVNGSGTGAYSNEVYGFPFPAEDVVWWYDGTESSKVIVQDGGVEATIITWIHYPNGCWYTSCQLFDPSYVGLSPPHYAQQIPKYAMKSKVNSTNAMYVMVDGADVKTISGSGVVRVERVGTTILFLMNDVVYHTVTTTETNLVADKYEPAAGTVTNVKIYGAHIQPPADILDLVARPAVGWQEVGLEWSIPPANDDPITDFVVEYSVDDDNGPWLTFPHSPIVPAVGDTTASVLVTGLNGGVPGRADFFRVTAVNSQGVSNPSNVVHGFPFIKADVTWIDLDSGASDAGGGLLNGNGTAESFQFIEQDGGIEAAIISGGSYSSGCWYSSCFNDTYAYAGLSPATYDQQVPKYAFMSTGEANVKVILVNGSQVATVQASSGSLARVERVGTTIHFVYGDVVRYIVNLTQAESEEILIADALVTGQNSRVDATIFGAINPVTVNAFNAVEPATHNHDVPSTDPVTGTIHTKVVGQEISLNIVALRDIDSDGDPDAVETTFSTNVNRRVQVQLGTVVDPSLSCTAPNNFTVWQPTMDVYNDAIASYVPVNWGTTGIQMVFRATDPGQKTLKFKIYDQANQNIGLMMTDVDLSTCSLSSDTFTLRPDRYQLFAGQGDGVTVGQIPANETPGDSALDNNNADNPPDANTKKHKAGRPVRLRISALDVCDASTPSCTVQPVQNFNHNMELADTVKGHADMSDTAGVFSSVLLNLYDRDAVNPIQFVPADGGVTTIDDATYDEVGIITISIANDADYAANDATDGSSAADLEITGATLNVGRFVPDHFTFDSNGNIEDNLIRTEGINSTFTYIEQPFSIDINNVVIEAQNAQGDLTENYTGSFWKLIALPVVTAADNTGATDLGGNPITFADTNLVSGSALPGSDGAIMVSYDAVGISFDRPIATIAAAPLSPLINLNINDIADTDGVKFSQLDLGDIAMAEQRLGRVLLSPDNCSGTDAVRTVTVTLKSLTASGWLDNDVDDCGGNCPNGVENGLNVNNVVLNGGAPGAVAIDGAVTITPSIPAWPNHENKITLTSSDTGYNGSVTVTTNPLSWLTYDPSNPPSATVSFNCAPGSNNIMYQREALR